MVSPNAGLTIFTFLVFCRELFITEGPDRNFRKPAMVCKISQPFWLIGDFLNRPYEEKKAQKKGGPASFSDLSSIAWQFIIQIIQAGFPVSCG